ncbi:uncharacterized protein OCT59_013828 [Rhizophagus irregularis]|uniref:uncharacterized protein n=1 Tax=Rhizophagus irregularis TaxID=588596 RepID=UPI00333060BD|nr:hypothetical protein OCT59_013828 [Rhizophagus irregularis]
MATKRGEKRRIDDNERFSKRSTEELVKKVSKILFENFVYPSQDEYKLVTEKYLKDENPEFMRQFKKNQWIIFFEKKIAPTLVQQHRSIRGTFTSRVKDVMYSVFEATGHKLPSINTQASPSKIQEWKTYAISICETYLNPNNQNIQMSESIMKSKIINNLQKLENRDKFTHSDDDSHDGNDVDDGGDRAADDRAGAADDDVTNDGRRDGATNDDA